MDILKGLPKEKLLSLLLQLINKEVGYNLFTDETLKFKSSILQQGYGKSIDEKKIIIEVKKFDIEEIDLLDSEINQTVKIYNTRQPEKFIVIVPEYLEDEAKNTFVNKVITKCDFIVELWDAAYIDEIIEKNKDVYDNQVVPWHTVYNELSKLLADFNFQCGLEKKHAGRVLYDKCMKFKTFSIQNKWIEKFDSDYGIKSLDPFHVFFAINAGKITYENRVTRINQFLKILGGKEQNKDILFVGCPSPNVAQILSTRTQKSQDEIWSVFTNIYLKKRTGFGTNTFKRFYNWKGIQLSSFSMFLFWIDSNKFLPLDQNVNTFIVASRVSSNNPKSYHTYISLLKKLDKANLEYNQNYKYGKGGIFRELTHVAYTTIQERKKEVRYSLSLYNLLNRVKSSTDQISNSSLQKIEDIDVSKPKSIKKSIELDAQNDFKIIAIKPLENCSDNILKVLKDNFNSETIYHFEKTIEITSNSIKYFPERDLKLYDSNNGKQRINITAVVGKNGSGKSTLIELFFRILNHIAYNFKNELSTTVNKDSENIEVELYYLNFGFLNKLVISNSTIKIQKFALQDREYKKSGRLKLFKKNDLENFFYTIAVNYSIYGLNSLELGPWIDSMIRKNDGYQIPLVINPMRTKGNININRENQLLSNRFVSNLLEPTEAEDIGFKQITEKQKAIAINLIIIKNKNRILYKTESEEEIPFEKINEDFDKLWKQISNFYEIDNSQIETPVKIIRETKKYIIRKLIRISLKYFKKENYFDTKKNEFEGLKLYQLLDNLSENRSHITDKLMQAINYLKYPKNWPKTNKFTIDLSKRQNNFENILSSTDIKTIELIPPPIFSYEIMIENEFKGVSSMNQLSSGEKQMIHSTSSIIYHLRNINSVVEGTNKVKYHFVNLCLDEIELYYHPEMQRKYVYELVQAINRIYLDQIYGINICLVTHSPYILSDIPSNFTLRMGDSNATNSDYKTFGANIHEILTHDFFMNKGFIGEFAKKKINETISFLTFHINNKEIEEFNEIHKNNIPEYVKLKKTALESENVYIQEELKIDTSLSRKNHHISLIEVIGEKVVRLKLKEMTELAFSN
ncbi:AAA family ATPase [Olleya sp. HaHaR_3_96]|uniref:AAA family ATPase n=1 Tax=Olleya sp. HaHaR_3_96 TaxID=2745560 RepID=UPI001C4F2EC5|nr:AAA family ATPase [Olleya sp. HaHaR_3_96]QXP59389.1 ATP-binding protein [Olleya sp. HaHaR_3_96]